MVTSAATVGMAAIPADGSSPDTNDYGSGRDTHMCCVHTSGEVYDDYPFSGSYGIKLKIIFLPYILVTWKDSMSRCILS